MTTPRVFRLFVSSTFEEMKAERDALQRVFADLSRVCQQRRHTFHAIDLRWGIADEGEMGWRAISVCLREVERCVASGRRPNMLLLMGSRRGTLPAPECIEASTFDRLTACIGSPADLAFVRSWYRRDDHALPPRVELTPPAQHGRSRARSSDEERRLQSVLAAASAVADLGAGESELFERSATERELAHYLELTGGSADGLVCLRRRGAGSDAALGARRPWSAVPGDRIVDYEYDPSADAEARAQALTAFEELARRQLLTLIEQELTHSEQMPRWQLERDAHTRLARERGREICGRGAELEYIARYLRAEADQPLLIVGEGGVGKTALLARAYLDCAQRSTALVCARMIGAGADNMEVRTLLASLRSELSARFALDEASLPPPKNALAEELELLLRLGQPDRPLVLFLDAIDQLQREAGEAFAWLPRKLPAYARLVVSCLAAPAAPLLRRFDAAGVLHLQPLSAVDRALLIDQLLAQQRRTLPRAQRAALLDAAGAGFPLYLRTACFEACANRAWLQAGPPPADTPGLLAAVIARLQREHGPRLVERAAALLSAARHGLTEDELLLLLSADREVAAEATERALHPIQQGALPLVLWVLLRDALDPYLMLRAHGASQVLTFYHRELQQAVRGGFVDAQILDHHAALAGFFEARLAPGLPPQPDQARATSELPYQLVQMRETGARLEACLASFDFVLSKVAAQQLEELLLDYGAAAAAGANEAIAPWADFANRYEHVLRRVDEAWPPHKTLLQLAMETPAEQPVGAAARAWLASGGCDWPWLGRPPARDGYERLLVRAFEAHRGAAVEVALLSDRRLLSWSDLGLWSWHLDSGVGQELSAAPTRAVVVLDDGTALSLHPDGAIRRWDAASGASLGEAVMRAAFPQRLLLVDQDRILIWAQEGCEAFDLKSEQQVAWREGAPDTRVWALGGGWLLARDGGSNTALWSARDGTRLSVFAGVGEPTAVHRLDDSTLVIGSHEGWVHAFAVPDGRPRWRAQLHAKRVGGILQLRSGELVTYSWDGTLCCFDPETGEELRRFHAFDSPLDGALELPSGQIAAWAFDPCLKVWDPATGNTATLAMNYETYPQDACVLPAGRLVAWGRLEGRLNLWNLERMAHELSLPAHDAPPSGVHPVGSNLLLSWAADGIIRLWKLEDLTEQELPRSHVNRAAGALTLDELGLVTWGFEDPELKLWSFEDGSMLAEGRGHTGGVRQVIRLSPQSLLSCSYDATLRIWSLPDLRLLTTMEGHTDTVLGVLPGTHGRLVSYSYDGDLLLWDLARPGAPERRLRGHTNNVFGAAWLPDGKLVSWSNDRSIRVWDVESGAQLACLESGNESGGVPITLLAWTGGQLLSGSNSGRLCCWDLVEQRALLELDLFRDLISGLRRLRDGRLAVWCGNDDVPTKDYRVLIVDLDGVLRPVVLDPGDGGTEALAETADGQIVTRSVRGPYYMFRLWDARTGDCLEAVPAARVADCQPDWLTLPGMLREHCEQAPYVAWDAARFAGIAQPDRSLVVRWQGDSIVTARALLADGTVALTTDKGEVNILKLHRGAARIPLTDL